MPQGVMRYSLPFDPSPSGSVLRLLNSNLDCQHFSRIFLWSELCGCVVRYQTLLPHDPPYPASGYLLPFFSSSFWYILFLVRISPYFPPIWIFENVKSRLERRRTTANSRNNPAAHSDKKRQKKNRKGSVTSTVIGNISAINRRFYFLFHGEK